MGKVINLGEVKEIKELPMCPLYTYSGEACKHTGISFSPASSERALNIAKIISDNHKNIRLPAKDYLIVDTMTLLAQIPLQTNTKVLRGTLKTLPTMLIQASEKAAEAEISCYNMAVYYHTLYPDIFILTENEHSDYFTT